MSVTENKNVVRRFYDEVVNGRKLAVVDEILAENFVEHYASSGSPQGRDGFKQFVRMLGAAFPDLQLSVEAMIGEGNMVVARVVVRGTHQGTLMGNIPATGKTITMSGIDIFGVSGGRIVERWGMRDLLGLMQQLGVIQV